MTVWMVAPMKNPNNFRLDGNSLPASDGGSVQSTVQTSAHLAEKGLDLLFAEASMVAVSIDSSVDLVVIVPHFHRHP